MKDLVDMMNELDHWDALIRDYEMKLDKDDIFDKMRQAVLFSMAAEVVVENKVAGSGDLDNCAKVRSMINDMNRDRREARGAIKLCGGVNQPPPGVHQLNLREVTSDLAQEGAVEEATPAPFQLSLQGWERRHGSVEPRIFRGWPVANE